MYELPNWEGYLAEDQVLKKVKEMNFSPIRIQKLESAKHIFSHVEWHMIGYEILVDELEREMKGDVLFASLKDLAEKYPMPSAFEAYMPQG